MYKSYLLNRSLLLMIAVLAFTVVPNFGVSAALIRCRTDPIFTFSNGDKVTIVLDISTDESSVLYVNYIVHVPAGVTLKNVVFTAGGIGKLETYWIVQDSPDGIYTTQTFLMAKQSSVPIVATTSLGSKFSVSVEGFSGQNISATVGNMTINTFTAKMNAK